MADEDNTNPQPIEEQATGDNNDPKPVPYNRFKQVNDQLRQSNALIEQLQAERKQQEEAALAEENKYKELYETREAELKAEKQAHLRAKVALKLGLPAEIAGRLQGDTEEALMTDAQGLQALLKPASPGMPKAPKPGATTITATQLDDPKWVRENTKNLVKDAKLHS